MSKNHENFGNRFLAGIVRYVQNHEALLAVALRFSKRSWYITYIKPKVRGMRNSYGIWLPSDTHEDSSQNSLPVLFGWMQTTNYVSCVGVDGIPFPLRVNQSEPSLTLEVLISSHNAGGHVTRIVNEILSQTLWPGLRFAFFLNCESEFVIRSIRQLEDFLPEHVRVIEASSHTPLYQAWNELLIGSRAEFVVNWNMDDSVGPTSFWDLARVIESVPSASFWYSDFYIRPSVSATWDETVQHGVVSNLVPVSKQNMVLSARTPHAFVSWRRSVHRDIGFFDPKMRVAGDLDLWLRLLDLGKTGHLHAQPLYGYYQNPDGLSTSQSTRAIAIQEVRRVTETANDFPQTMVQNQKTSHQLYLQLLSALGDF